MNAGQQTRVTWSRGAPRGAPQSTQGAAVGSSFTRVLLSLVCNAIKFTDAGEVPVTAKAINGHFAVSVVDTGPRFLSAERLSTELLEDACPPVMFAPGCGRLATKPEANGVGNTYKYDRYRPRLPLECSGRHSGVNRQPRCWHLSYSRRVARE